MSTKKKKQQESEKDILYVLKRPDGSVRAELIMNPSLAKRINAGRRKKGFLDGDWEPQQVSQYGLWHLDFNTLPDWMLACLKKAQQDAQTEATQAPQLRLEDEPWRK